MSCYQRVRIKEEWIGLRSWLTLLKSGACAVETSWYKEKSQCTFNRSNYLCKIKFSIITGRNQNY